jgi:phospholipase/carboxylesterase
MIDDPLQRPHVWQPGSGTPPLLLLHGTGGNEHDLLGLRDHLALGAPVLSPRGSVSEHGMPRFFRRIREGVFDENDLRLRADELVAFLAAAEQKYAVAAGSWLAVGFSNGANMASALLLRHPESLAGAVLSPRWSRFRTRSRKTTHSRTSACPALDKNSNTVSLPAGLLRRRRRGRQVVRRTIR